MITQEQYKLIENALCELKLNNENIFSYGDGYDDAIDEALEQVKKFTIPDVVGQSEQCCEPIGEGFYLGTSCPKCKQPFRQNLK